VEIADVHDDPGALERVDDGTGGTLFPLSSKQVARALPRAACARWSCSRTSPAWTAPPDSLRNLQLEYGAEIGWALVNFRGPLPFCVVARYHGAPTSCSRAR
jgi:hypothetical protein